MAPVEGVESGSTGEEAVVEGLLGQGSAGRVTRTRHQVHRHAACQLCHCHVKLPAQHQSSAPFSMLPNANRTAITHAACFRAVPWSFFYGGLFVEMPQSI